jgi:heme/copper-type cytochrome/quinol oxidase subunit 4
VHKGSLKSEVWAGLMIFIVLLVLAVTQYVLAQVVDSGILPFLVIISVGGASVVLYYSMHLDQLWSSEE